MLQLGEALVHHELLIRSLSPGIHLVRGFDDDVDNVDNVDNVDDNVLYCFFTWCEGCYLYASIFERYHQELELSKASQFKMYTMF